MPHAQQMSSGGRLRPAGAYRAGMRLALRARSGATQAAQTRMARLAATASAALVCACAALVTAVQAEPAWTTYHRDPGRSGYDPEGTSPIVPVLARQSVGLGAPIFQQP